MAKMQVFSERNLKLQDFVVFFGNFERYHLKVFTKGDKI